MAADLRRQAQQRDNAYPIARGFEQDRHGRCAYPAEQQDVALPLMITFGMVMLDIFAGRSPQRPW
jgi:hypothetical protein